MPKAKISYNIARHVDAIIIEIDEETPYYYDIQTVVNILTNYTLDHGKQTRTARVRKYTKSDTPQ
jgi:hypothetical protein